MKTRTKKKFNWKHWVITAIVSGLLFSGLLILFNHLFGGHMQSVKIYVFQGLLFGILIAFTIPFLSRKFGTAIDRKVISVLDEDENIEFDGPANLLRGIEGVGGKIFLTNERMFFLPHGMNIQKQQVIIEYGKIESVAPRKTAGLIGNGLRVITISGDKYDFVLYNPKLWIEKIRERIKQEEV